MDLRWCPVHVSQLLNLPTPIICARIIVTTQAVIASRSRERSMAGSEAIPRPQEEIASSQKTLLAMTRANCLWENLSLAIP
jgi:hypothetical protein